MRAHTVALALASPLALALVLGPAPPAAAQARDARDRLEDRLREGPVRAAADHVEADEVEGRLIAAGNVAVEIGRDALRLFLYADAVALWGAVRARRVEEVRAIYAEGDVLLAIGGQSFQADALFLDLVAGEGRLANATVRSEDRGGLLRALGAGGAVVGTYVVMGLLPRRRRGVDPHAQEPASGGAAVVPLREAA